MQLADPVVLGLPRGGVVVAAPVARRLAAPMSVVIVRKLGVPWQPELAFGALEASGATVIDQDLVDRLGISENEIQAVVASEMVEAARRAEIYGATALEVNDRVVVLVDDGLATGATMLAALRSVMEGRPKEVVVAVPVASRQAVRMLEDEGARVVALEAPRGFRAVGAWYEDFRQTTDEEVLNELRLTSTQSRSEEESQP